MKKSTVGTQAQRLRQAIRHRQAQEKQELRQAILTAAGTLFLEQGYERFSLRKVAERIGYSPTTIYLYFRDKDDLLFTVVDEGFVRFGQQLAAATESQEDPWERREMKSSLLVISAVCEGLTLDLSCSSGRTHEQQTSPVYPGE